MNDDDDNDNVHDELYTCHICDNFLLETYKQASYQQLEFLSH